MSKKSKKLKKLKKFKRRKVERNLNLPYNNNLDNYEHFTVPICFIGTQMFIWYSLCSEHRSHEPTCELCNTGSWFECTVGERKDNGNH